MNHHHSTLQFRLLTPGEQAERIRRLAASGLRERDITALTGWDIDLVRRAIAEHVLDASRRAP